MTTQNDLLLEHRISELELVVHRLERQLSKLATTPAPAPPPPAKYTAPAARTVIHEKRVYDFEAKMPAARLVVDFFSRNKNTTDVVHIGYFSPTQIERECFVRKANSDPS